MGIVGWATVLIIAAVLLYVLEIFIPSGGIVGFFATGSLIAGVICLFWIDTTIGLIATVIVLITAPFVLALFIKIFPDTPIGRLLTLRDRQEGKKVNYDRDFAEVEDQLVGKQGVAVSGLRPVGTCEIDGKRFECLAEGGIIDGGEKIEVTRVAGMEIKVRRIS